MRVFTTVAELRQQIDTSLRKQGSIGFVPTMGTLHDGHLSLVRASRKENKFTIVSVFVNPTQFGPNEDFDRYPRNLEEDQALLEKEGVDVIFAPEISEMYPSGKSEILFSVRSLANLLCGSQRDGHFEGVVQIVTKLFNIIRPDRAYFGEKDFQQLVIIKRLAEELFFETEVIGCPIVREPDGLAMSSRNLLLSQEGRKQAIALKETLDFVVERCKTEPRVEVIRQEMMEFLKAYPLAEFKYFEILHTHDLTPIQELHEGIDARVLISISFGGTRLLDNMQLIL